MKTFIAGALIASMLYLPVLGQINDPLPDEKSSIAEGICIGVIVVIAGAAIIICLKRMADRIPDPNRPVPPPPQQPQPQRKTPPPAKKKVYLGGALDWYDATSYSYIDTNGASPAVYTRFGAGSLEWAGDPNTTWQKQYTVLAWFSANGLFLSFQSNGVPVVNTYQATLGNAYETNYIDLPTADLSKGFFRITPGL